MAKAKNVVKGVIPWDNYSKIKCCKDCVAPKRHLGCHDTCKEYKEQKKEHEAKKEKERTNRAVVISKYDFEMLPYISKRRK